METDHTAVTNEELALLRAVAESAKKFHTSITWSINPHQMGLQTRIDFVELEQALMALELSKK